jgi:hypothetical protein
MRIQLMLSEVQDWDKTFSWIVECQRTREWTTLSFPLKKLALSHVPDKQRALCPLAGCFAQCA